MEDKRCTHGFSEPCFYCQDGQILEEKLDIINRAIKERRLLQFDYVVSEYTVHHCIQFSPEHVTDTEYLIGHNAKNQEYGRYSLNGIRLLEVLTLIV